MVSELASNLVKHARGGRLYQGPGWGRDSWLVVSLDDGPGLPEGVDVLVDGVSSTGTFGLGLGAVQRMSTRFVLCGGPTTAVFAQIGGAVTDPLVFDWSLHASGNGDVWGGVRDRGRLRLVVFDGNGSGVLARSVAEVAAQTVFEQTVETSLEGCLVAADRACRTERRGCVGSVFDLRRRSVRWVGAGDVSAAWETATMSRSLPMAPGIVGRDVGRTAARTIDVQDGWLSVHTDGITMDPSPVASPVHRLLAAIRGHRRGEDSLALIVPTSSVMPLGE